MIVISQSLVLSQSQDESSDHPVIGYDNLVTIDNIAADTEETNYPAINLANPSTALKWVGEVGTSEQYLTVLVDQIEDIDYLAVARHNFSSGAIAVTVEGRAEELDEYSVLVEEVMLPDDGPVLFRFTPQSLFQIRLKMEVGDSAPEAAVLYVGKLLIAQRKIYVGHTPIPYGRETKMATGMSESGNFLGRIVLNEFVETTVDLQNLTPAWYRSEMDPFIIASKEAPFFFAWRPGSYPREVGYAWMTNNPKPVNQRNNGMMSISLSMGGISL